MNTTQILTRDEVGILLAAAAHAPLVDDTHHWTFEINGAVFGILHDPEQAWPAGDPAGRLARIGLGAAAFNIRVAAAMLGHESTFAIEPDPATPKVAVRIYLGDRQGPVHGLSSLYGVLGRRYTYHGPMLEQPVSTAMIQRLTEAARSERAVLHWLDHEQKAMLIQLVEARQAEVPQTFEQAPSLVVLATAGEDERAWTRAGFALQRVLLTAASYDLVAAFLEQVIEEPDLRDQVRTLIGRTGWPQLAFRLGYPAHDAPEHTA